MMYEADGPHENGLTRPLAWPEGPPYDPPCSVNGDKCACEAVKAMGGHVVTCRMIEKARQEDTIAVINGVGITQVPLTDEEQQIEEELERWLGRQ